MAYKQRKRSRSSKNFAAIPISGTPVLSTLGNQAVLIDDVFGGNLTEDFYGISVDLSAQIINLTSGEGDPIVGGFAHGDYSAPEIAENLDVIFLGPGTKIEQERSRRLVRKTGQYTFQDSVRTTMRLQGRVSPGGITRTKLKFVINSGKTLSLYLQNISGAALTTGASLRYNGTVYGRWMP